MPIAKLVPDVRVNSIIAGTQGRPAIEAQGGSFVVAWGNQTNPVLTDNPQVAIVGRDGAVSDQAPLALLQFTGGTNGWVELTGSGGVVSAYFVGFFNVLTLAVDGVPPLGTPVPVGATISTNFEVEALSGGINAIIFTNGNSVALTFAGGQNIIPVPTTAIREFGNATNPDLARLSGNGIATVWEQDTAAGKAILLRLFDGGGAPRTSDIVVNAETGSRLTHFAPAVTQLTNGSIVVAWTSREWDDPLGFSFITARIFNSNGVPLGEQLHQRLPGTATQGADLSIAPHPDGYISPFPAGLVGGQSPDVLALPDGRFALLYTAGYAPAPVTPTNNTGPLGTNLYIRLFTADGQACGEAQIVHDRLIGNQATSGSAGDIWNPAYEAVVNRNGMIGITWQDRGVVHDPAVGGDPGDIMFTLLNPFVSNVGRDGLWRGGDMADRITGAKSDDSLYGNGGNDVIRGQSGRDQIVGGAGADVLTGGKSRDTFIFTASTDSAAGPRTLQDTITDFEAGSDQLQFAFDFNTNQSDVQRFNFIGTAAFSGTAGNGRGQVRFEQGNGETRVMGDTNGDGQADFVVVLEGFVNLTNADLLWGDFG